jgi:lysophospholipase L1-like esterase/catechol 2,3-dioxygenase-like lactoylglutathione lyase family enzyme
MNIMKYVFALILLMMFAPELSDAQDWANLNRYKDDNAKMGAPAANENRVVFMGNSITDGWIQTVPEFFAGKSYIDRGISGQTTPQMLIRFKPDVVALEPKVVVILAGTNDIAGNTGPSTLEMIEDNLSSMVQIAKENNITVVLSSVLPAYDYPWRPGLQPAEKIVTLNKWIKNYADENNCIYLDYFSSMVDDRKGLKTEYTKDGVHPNAEGYKVMGALAEKAIAKALEKNESASSEKSPVVDHTTVYVVDLEKSTAFYENVMQLKRISEPFKDGKHNWFRIGEHSQLHVVSGAKAVVPHDINIHLAFKVASLPEFTKHLDKLLVKYGNWQGEKKIQMRPDGIGQIYLQDPDGYWIEVNDDKF